MALDSPPRAPEQLTPGFVAPHEEGVGEHFLTVLNATGGVALYAVLAVVLCPPFLCASVMGLVNALFRSVWPGRALPQAAGGNPPAEAVDG
jgi:hypothetical protein